VSLSSTLPPVLPDPPALLLSRTKNGGITARSLLIADQQEAEYTLAT